jgi:hypothetical protein
MPSGRTGEQLRRPDRRAGARFRPCSGRGPIAMASRTRREAGAGRRAHRRRRPRHTRHSSRSSARARSPTTTPHMGNGWSGAPAGLAQMQGTAPDPGAPRPPRRPSPSRGVQRSAPARSTTPGPRARTGWAGTPTRSAAAVWGRARMRPEQEYRDTGRCLDGVRQLLDGLPYPTGGRSARLSGLRPAAAHFASPPAAAASRSWVSSCSAAPSRWRIAPS